jgi:glutathione synthase/RimK-type ligase-like ATP-grasp enzyme
LTTPVIALATAIAARPLDEDLAPLSAAIERLGLKAETPAWDDPAVDWRRYALVALRSTWNYTERPGDFLRWVQAIARHSELVNTLPTVHWNLDKRYLEVLREAGLPIVPTTFTGPGAKWQAPPFSDFVIKPSVGAGSRGAKRFRRSEAAAAAAHVARLQAAGQSAMTQPYLDAVDSDGETALVFLGGEYSHSVRKGPLLQHGAGDVQGLFAVEEIQPRSADERQLAIGARVLELLPERQLAFARIDLIRDGSGEPRILEVEVTEPSLFFNYAPTSADRLAALLLARLAAPRGRGAGL